ncbi:MAG: hypothetical protein IPO75_07915 [Betaproteobacteria bacterium]|nr:hypothetical protein [Betaproteobacteria bacterium]MBK9703392.1 hypothetical protein [Betaproteobacteria bacterium]
MTNSTHGRRGPSPVAARSRQAYDAPARTMPRCSRASRRCGSSGARARFARRRWRRTAAAIAVDASSRWLGYGSAQIRAMSSAGVSPLAACRASNSSRLRSTIRSSSSAA